MPIRLSSLGGISSLNISFSISLYHTKVFILFFIFILAHPSLSLSTFTLTHQIFPFPLSQHHIDHYINISLDLPLNALLKYCKSTNTWIGQVCDAW
jgi:hypothetical protein